ncbi:MAG TPA: SusC/RagA family TonB-linked outer membrane protein [Dinghuibacter sp.]|uniref:SusC/RagA family TonB-linked outer membrane protein n=1 Tax=Dinghuibacter sp. TaxID=2024697 RepID=UPI002B81CA53|nr:SusC/RagA family TonB-linked outer membrane protein [Dinghuibacter sp.]HTJ11611.1 SusC/RagA family TonB-linked outer membrane protein [Dinghuibacter sp.]
MLLQRRRILFLILSFLCASHLSFAQGKITVSGTVASDSSNAPLSNVSIKIKGKAGGTTSDANGVFTIKVDKGSTLVFSIVGYEDKEVRIESEATGLSVRLTAKISNLSDVVVIGYGTQKLKDVTSSISTVSLSDERQRPVVNIMQELAGKAAGVQVQQFNGAPGQDFQVLVRGFTSLSGNANPVYVVDGIVGYNIASLDVNNIASITILKDASATGIYGVAGSANGVVQITTKKGVSGAPRIDVDFSNSYQTVAKKLKVLNGEQLHALQIDEYVNAGRASDTASIRLPAGWQNINNNWQDKLFRTAPITKVSARVSGGGQGGNYALNLGYLNQDGIMPTISSKKFFVGLTAEQTLNKWLTIGGRADYARQTTHNMPGGTQGTTGHGGGGSGAVTGAAVAYSPYVSEKDPTTGFFAVDNSNGQAIPNPLAQLYGTSDITTYNIINAEGHAVIHLPFGISYTNRISANISDNFENITQDPTVTSGANAVGGTADYQTFQNFTWLWDNILEFSRSFGKHNIDVIGGLTAQKYSTQYSENGGSGFPIAGIYSISSAGSRPTTQDNGGYDYWSKYSQYARLMYNYDSRYLLTATIRRDGASQLGINNEFAVFPAASVGWRISNEQFMKHQTIFSDLKVRAGYGETGNLPASLYPSYNVLNVAGGQYTYDAGGASYPGLGLNGTAANPNIKWEQTNQLNIGTDMAFLNNRLRFTADYYNKHTTNLIYTSNLPPSSGQSNVVINLPGKVVNNGLELAVSADILASGPIRWTSNFNVSFNKNVIRANITPISGGGIPSGAASWLKNGYSIGSFFGYISQGVDPQTGYIKYADPDKTGAAENGLYLGNALPKAFGGFSNDFTYKNFTLDVLITYAFGNKVFNANRYEEDGMYDLTNQLATTLGRWRKPGDVTSLPLAILGENASNQANNPYENGNDNVSSRYVENGSFVRFQNIALSYDFTSFNFIKSIGLRNLRAFVSLENMITITKYSGYSPDLNNGGTSPNTQGLDFGTYPLAKSVNLGLNVGF